MGPDDIITVAAISSHRITVTIGVARDDSIVTHRSLPCRWHELGEAERRAALAEALRQAEDAAGIGIRSLFLSRSSPSIASRLSTGHASLGEELVLRDEEKGWALRRAREQATGIAHEVVMTLPVRWKVRDRSGERDVDDPIGVRGSHLSCEALLITAEPGHVQSLRDLAMAVERELEGIIPPPVGLYRGIASRLQKRGSSLVLDLGARHTSLLVHRRDRLVLLETHRGGGDDLTEALAEELDLEWDAAEALKHQVDLDAASEPGETRTDIRQQDLFRELAQEKDLLRRAARICRDEIDATFRKLADDLRAHGHLAQQGTLHLVGRGAALGGLPRHLGELFDLPVRLGSGASDRDAGSELDGLITVGLVRAAADLRRQALSSEGPTVGRAISGLWGWLTHRYQ